MSQDSQASTDVPEPTPLEYARANGLSRDYLTEAPGSEELLRLQSSVSAHLIDSTRLAQFNLGSAPKVEERLILSKNAALLLQSVIREETRVDIDSLISPMFNTRNQRSTRKLELPLLRSDHETDYRSFGSREGVDITLEDIKLPLEVVDDEKNEGFIYPAANWNMGPETMRKLKAQKPSVSRKTMMYLSDCVKPCWIEDDAQALWDSEQKYKRNTALDPVTPPLSPGFAPMQQPYEPSSSDSAYQLPLLSDPVSPTKQELEVIETMLLEQDIPTPLRTARAKEHRQRPYSDTLSDDPIKLGDIYTPLASMDNTPPSLEVKRMKREDLKVEETLTPSNSSITMPKTVRFSDVVEEMELDADSRFNSPDFGDKFLEDAFGDSLKKADQQAEQEKLIAADATARVDVPILDFSKADPPWKAFERVQNRDKLELMQLSFIRDVVCSRLPKTLSVRNKDLKLQWSPFPNNLAKVVLEETILDDGHKVETFLTQVTQGDIIDSSGLTWKPEGLKILKDEDDDEIDFGVFHQDNPRDLFSLVKKRKMELQEADQVREERSSKKVAPTAQQSPAGANSKRADCRQSSVVGTREQGSLLSSAFSGGGAFSAGSALDNFLELRGAKTAKLTDSTYFTSKPNTAKAALQTERRIATPQTMQFQIRSSPLPKGPSLPAPVIPTTPPATNVIVSSALLKQRGLIKNVENILPELKMIERDFTAHNTTTWQPGSVTRSPIKSPLDSEADLIISPSTGVIITTLQKIRQKPLPGQSTKPAIRDWVEKVCGRYERLCILISEGRADETTNGLDENDCLAYSEFLGFVSGFSTTITAQFIAGGEETLAKWLASSILQHCVAGESDLLTEETHWELFLRRAGLNAFAAQAILARLKAPDGVDPTSPSKAGTFGLTAFVEMGREQRLRRFGEICGLRLMERVSDVVDACWD